MSIMSVENRDAGPFADALRAAIRARGLGLQRLRERLRVRGVTISLATLSYWQSGRSRPERRESLVALKHLEAVLEVPEGSLSALVGPPRPRGRWLSTVGDSLPLSALWPRPEPVTDALAEVDTTWDERLTRISQHDRVYVGPDGGEVGYTSRQVLRSEVDGSDRWVVILHTDEHDRPAPTVNAVRNCRLGRVVTRRADGLTVAELLFDRPLTRGETVITEHEIIHAAPYPVDRNYERKFRLPVREFVLEVSFDPAAMPARVEQYSRTGGGPELTVPATLDPGGGVHSVALDFGPGCFGFRWS
ncbi:helix-turn-helix domain-containing protein [Actinokineospora sp. HUAS TT18]|uniref:helix-turn-helix domain-containing protein n=1 Tax=Actinokineospora sp. HUAS TT18 TaxID=3447451 RepID=UPI003F520D93